MATPVAMAIPNQLRSGVEVRVHCMAASGLRCVIIPKDVTGATKKYVQGAIRQLLPTGYLLCCMGVKTGCVPKGKSGHSLSYTAVVSDELVTIHAQ